MQQTSWSRLIAAIGFLVACAVGVLTNIITESFSWTAGAALGVLVVAGMILAALQVTGRSARVEQRIGRRARLADSPTVAAGDATVDDRISGRGDIERSGIDVETGKVTRRVRGKVAGSGITIKK